MRGDVPGVRQGGGAAARKGRAAKTACGWTESDRLSYPQIRIYIRIYVNFSVDL